MKEIEAKVDEFSPKSSLGFVGMFIFMIAIFLFIPLFLENHYANLMLQFAFTGLILSIIYTLKSNHFILISGIALLLPFLIFDTLGISQDDMTYFLIAYSFLGVFLCFVIIILIQRILMSHFIDTNLIFGAITIYLLMGVLWGKLYFIISALIPGSFYGITNVDILTKDLGSFYLNQFNLLYYSFTSLTTLGMGDIYPLHRLAKSLTLLEAVVGQLFLATVITKVVSTWKDNCHPTKL